MRGTTLARRALDTFPALRTMPTPRSPGRSSRPGARPRSSARRAVRRQPAPPRHCRRVPAGAPRPRSICAAAHATSTSSRRSSLRAATTRRRRCNRWYAGHSHPRPRRQCRPVRPLRAAALAGQHCGILPARPGELRAAERTAATHPRWRIHEAAISNDAEPIRFATGQYAEGRATVEELDAISVSCSTCSRSPAHGASISSRWTSRAANGRSSPTPGWRGCRRASWSWNGTSAAARMRTPATCSPPPGSFISATNPAALPQRPALGVALTNRPVVGSCL